MNEETNLPEGLQLAVKLLAQIGDDDSDRAIAAVHAAADERDNLIDAMREEIDEGLRLRELGGALPDENITSMTERVIKERDALRARMAEIEGQEPVAISKAGNLFWAGNPQDHRGVDCSLYARPVHAQAVPDADAARYRWLSEKFGVTQLPVLLERAAGRYVADYKESIDATIDGLMIAAAPEVAR